MLVLSEYAQGLELEVEDAVLHGSEEHEAERIHAEYDCEEISREERDHLLRMLKVPPVR